MSDDDAPMYPLMAFGTGLADGQVGLELELATDRDEYESREGSVLAIVMTPDHAIELANALIERAELAKRGDAPVN